jgi:spore maturation protein A
MINIIWAVMITSGILVSCFNGTIDEVNTGIISSAGDAVSLCISMVGIVGMWSGIMKVAEKSGLINRFSKKLTPVMKFLFPRIPADSDAYKYICTNIIANIAGLGWAATPPALRAMRELAAMNKNSHIASREMCLFLILNISSLQLIPVNIIAYRASYGAANPAFIIIPGFIATLCSTTTAIIICAIINKREEKLKQEK